MGAITPADVATLADGPNTAQTLAFLDAVAGLTDEQAAPLRRPGPDAVPCSAR